VKYGAGSLTLDEMKQVFSCASDEFHSAFLKRAGMDVNKIPKGQAPKIARCVKWAEEPNAEHRSFVLLTIAELKEVYRKKKGRAPKSSWSKASDLITHILASEEENAPSAPSNM
jgi:hypothetical protein